MDEIGRHHDPVEDQAWIERASMLAELNRAQGVRVAVFIQVHEIVRHGIIVLALIGAMKQIHEIVDRVQVLDHGQFFPQRSPGGADPAGGLCVPVLDPAGRMQRFQLAVKDGDEGAQVLQRAHVEPSARDPGSGSGSDVDVQAAVLVGVEPEFGHEQLDRLLDLLQRTARVGQSRGFQLDGVPVLAGVDRSHRVVGGHGPFRKVFAQIAISGELVFIEDLDHVPTYQNTMFVVKRETTVFGPMYPFRSLKFIFVHFWIVKDDEFELNAES